MVIGTSRAGEPITADDIGAGGALTVLMKDAIMPNLMQTLEGTPAFVHAGPFANIAHGNSSILADQIALKLVGKDGYVLTEAGFGADIGMEKFCNIKCRVQRARAQLRRDGRHDPRAEDARRRPESGRRPAAASCLHRRKSRIARKGLLEPRQDDSKCAQVRNPRGGRGEPLQDGHAGRDRAGAQERDRGGRHDAVMANHWAEGGAGAVELGKAVIAACEKPSKFQFLYPLEIIIKEKIETIVREITAAPPSNTPPRPKRRSSSTLAWVSTNSRSAWPRRISA